jgi:hypothetical protein
MLERRPACPAPTEFVPNVAVPGRAVLRRSRNCQHMSVRGDGMRGRPFLRLSPVSLRVRQREARSAAALVAPERPRHRRDQLLSIEYTGWIFYSLQQGIFLAVAREREQLSPTGYQAGEACKKS